MIEIVNPEHPDKIADRIAGALVDKAYTENTDPHIAVEVLIGHRLCTIIIETDTVINYDDIKEIVHRITKDDTIEIRVIETNQDPILHDNTDCCWRTGDNGIFKGTYMTSEETELSYIAHNIFNKWPSDGKYILDSELIICQSNAHKNDIKNYLLEGHTTSRIFRINPLGYWTGGTNVDTGATNRKLGSDMGAGVTGGGLHGKDLSKADVTVNVFLHRLAQILEQDVYAHCAIGDEYINVYTEDGDFYTYTYEQMIRGAKEYIEEIGGFEKFAEWGFHQ